MAAIQERAIVNIDCIYIGGFVECPHETGPLRFVKVVVLLCSEMKLYVFTRPHLNFFFCQAVKPVQW